MRLPAILMLLFCCVWQLAGNDFTPGKIANRSRDRIALSRNGEQVKVKVTSYHEWDGQAVLPQIKLEPGKWYEFSCRVQAPEVKSFYIQSKLFRNGRSIRIESEENASLDERVTLRFHSGNFERIEISLRNRCLEKSVGRTFTLSGFYFGAPREQKVRELPRLEIVPQYRSAGIYLNNCTSTDPAAFKASLFRRKKGEREFQKCELPLVYDFNAKALRASLLELESGTEYEVELDINDSGRRETLRSTFVTRSFDYPVAETVTVKSLPFKFKSGSEKGYIRYVSPRGVSLRGDETSREAINLDGLQYVILDGLDISGGRIEGISVRGAQNIVIRNCNIHHFGRIGTHRPDLDGRYYEKSYSLNNDCGVRIFNSAKVTVEKCVIHSARGTANSWFYTHPSGPNGIHIGDSRQVVLVGNDIFGSTFHRWNDAVESKGNGKLSGGVGSDAEVYGNYFAVGNDDGMELDGGQMNVRFAGNKVEDTLCGVSAAPCLIGPSYIYNNLFCGRGDVYFYKASGVKNNYSVAGTGAVFLFNNTICDYLDGVGGFSIREDERIFMKYPVFKFYSRRNLVRSSGPLCSKGVFRKEFICDTADDRMADCKDFPTEEKGVYCSKDGGKTGAPGVLPLRKTSFALDRAKVSFDAVDGKVLTGNIKVTAQKPCRLSVVCGADFFRVTPSEFELKANESRVLTVTTVPAKMTLPARFVSAFSVREPDGSSRPVLVECTTWNNPQLVAKARRNAVPGRVSAVSDDTVKIDFTVTKQCSAYLFLRCRNLSRVRYIQVALNGAKSERKMLRPAHGFENVWSIISGTTYNGKPNRPWKLAPGSYSLTVKGVAPQDITGFAVTEEPDAYRLAPGV